MARFLSPAWFHEASAGDGGTSAAGSGEVGEAGSDTPPAANGRGPDPEVVLEQVVDGTPEGRVVYRVLVSGGRARIAWPVGPGSPDPDLRLSTDWATSVEIAQGNLSAQRALMQGRLRVSGRPGRVEKVAGALAGLDPVPTSVRRTTTFTP